MTNRLALFVLFFSLFVCAYVCARARVDLQSLLFYFNLREDDEFEERIAIAFHLYLIGR